MEGHTLVPVVTFGPNDDPKAFMDFLIAQDVRCIEVTLRTPEGIKAIQALKQNYGSDVLIGAGTVTQEAQVAQLVAIGADFMVSPGLTPELHQVMERSDLPYLPGVATPSEIMRAVEMGLDTLKFFPADLFGGMKALKAYGQVFGDVAFCPTGGITRETSADFLALNNVFAVGGSWFQKEYKG